MGQSDITKYCELMEQVKGRIRFIDLFLSRLAIDAVALESMGLQVRKILELVAFGSLVANRNAYTMVHSGFAKDWNAGELLKKLEKVNSDFYPIPITELPPEKEGTKSKWVPRDRDYLAKEDFTEVYGRCGALVHAANPFGSGIDYAYYHQKVPIWRTQIVHLLNSHLIRLVNEPEVWLIHMKEERDEKVHSYVWKPLPPA